VSFPTPDVVKKTTNPALWDQSGGFAAIEADEANDALALLDVQLATASTSRSGSRPSRAHTYTWPTGDTR
jgi:hypothetical protein